MLTSPELISVTAETSHPQPRKMLSMEARWGGGGVVVVVVVQMTREKEVWMKREESEYGGRGEEGTKVGWREEHQ